MHKPNQWINKSGEAVEATTPYSTDDRFFYLYLVDSKYLFSICKNNQVSITQKAWSSIFESSNKVVERCNLKVPANEIVEFCESCQFGKAHSLPFSNSNNRAFGSFDLIHSDVWGPTPMLSANGYEYYVLFVDDYSQFTWLYPLKQKK